MTKPWTEIQDGGVILEINKEDIEDLTASGYIYRCDECTQYHPRDDWDWRDDPMFEITMKLKGDRK